MPKLYNDQTYLPTPKKRTAVGANLGAGAFTLPPPPSASGGLTGQIGSGGLGGSTTVKTVTPMQVYQEDILSNSAAEQGIFNTQATNLANARQQAILQALVNSGWTPEMTGALSGYASDVTQSALSQAAANPMSQKAQLDRQLSEAKGNTPYDLAASGAGRSGALAIQLGNLSRQYDTASYAGMQDLLGAITGAVNTY